MFYTTAVILFTVCLKLGRWMSFSNFIIIHSQENLSSVKCFQSEVFINQLFTYYFGLGMFSLVVHEAKMFGNPWPIGQSVFVAEILSAFF